ncbi:MAG TPA: hypothetical protein VNA22_08385 [Pyrinomonadaceae bacterium]|nr:hypothetical protein [Pyrinomonadaceae bacterium]
MFKTISFCFLVLTAGYAQLFGQPAVAQFTHGTGRFTIDRTTKAAREERVFPIANYELTGESFMWNDGGGDVTEVQHFVVSGPNYKLTTADKKKVIDAILKVFVETMTKAGAAVQQRPFRDGQLTGMELRATGATKLVSRSFFQGGRLYVLTYGRRSASFDEITIAMKGFRILSKSEYIEALIDDFTPNALPQSPANRDVVRSEARHEGLNGKVRSVSVESQQMPRGPRTPESRITYDEFGLLTKEISFFNGYPSSVEVYGWIDGKRVSISESVEYGLNEGPNEIQITTIRGIPMQMAAEAPGTRDERYSFMYVYQYDAGGNLVDRKVLGNDGEQNIRTEFINTKAQRHRLGYDSENKLSSKTVEILDEKGNVVEERMYDDVGRLEQTLVFTYEFDQNGNWIARKEFKKVRGKVAPSPTTMTFRRITYY